MTCFSKSGDATWVQFAFELGATTRTGLNVVGSSRIDGVWGRACSRYVTYLEGPNQGIIQGWGETPGYRLDVGIPIKKDAVVTGPLEAKLTLETYRGAKEATAACCLGMQAPNPEAQNPECLPLARAVLAAIRLTTADASLSDDQKRERVRRLQSLESIY